MSAPMNGGATTVYRCEHRPRRHRSPLAVNVIRDGSQACGRPPAVWRRKMRKANQPVLVSSTASSNGSLAKIGRHPRVTCGAASAFVTTCGVGDAEGLAVTPHPSAARRGDVLQPVTVWAVGQQYRHPRLSTGVGAEHPNGVR